jgi:hypothetical protein
MNPVQNPQFSDDFHRFVLQDQPLPHPNSIPSKPFDINVGKSKKTKKDTEKDKDKKKKK